MPKQLFFPTEPSAFPQPSPTSTSNTYRSVLFSFQKQVTLRTSAFQKNTKLTFSPPGYWKTQPKSKVPNVTWILPFACAQVMEPALPAAPGLAVVSPAWGQQDMLQVTGEDSKCQAQALTGHLFLCLITLPH